MLESTPALILILVAAAAGLTAIGMAVHMVRAQRKRHDSLDDEDSDTPAAGDEKAESASSHMDSQRQQANKAHSLFVIFPTPGADQKQAVIEWLRSVEARYDMCLRSIT